MAIIASDRSVIPACDVDEPRFRQLIESTHDLPGIGGYKIGAALALSMGLGRAVQVAREYTTKPLIYDHQKGCTDIPDTATEFVRVVSKCGIDAVIAFPLTGPDSELAFLRACELAGLPVMVGGHMTHSRYLHSQGGWIADDAIDRIFQKAASEGVTDFVLPGNKPDVISHLRRVIEQEVPEPTFYAPGFVTQGGAITEAAVEAGPRWHAIVGRGIYGADDIRSAAKSLSSQV